MKKQEEALKISWDKKLDRSWEWLLHEDRLMSDRISAFIVSESMLLTSFSIISSRGGLESLSNIFCLFGLVFSSLWFLVSFSQLKTTSVPLKKFLIGHLLEYGGLSKTRKVFGFDISIFSPGLVLPFVFLILWCVIYFLVL